MPLDKRKSIRYRSYVTCDDPRGVIECGAIRKSKTIGCEKRVQQLIIEGDKKQGNQNTAVVVSTCLAVIKENKKEMGVQRITREGAKGADKMNHVIKEKGLQDDIAKDLLRGALDRQESLIMLGKLKKEASSIMSESRRKQKQNFEEGRFDGMLSGVKATSANRGGYMKDEELYLGWRKPRKSSHELKKVVRESLLWQSLITNPIYEEDFDQRKVDCSGMPCTSSSQSSSMVRSSNFAMSDCSTPSTASQRRQKKNSNMIVKLKGPESTPLSPRWYREGDKLLSLSKHVYDIGSPRARKPHFGAQELPKKQRTVEEILESLNFKGLLSSPVNGSTSDSPSSDVFHFKDRRIDERPPIVIMKTSRYPCLNQEEPAMPRFWLAEDAKLTCSTTSVEENIGKEAGRKSVKKAAFATAKSSVNLDRKPKKKQSVPLKASKVEKVSPTRSKEEERKSAKFREEVCFRDQEKLTIPRLMKQKDGRFILKHHLTSHQDISSTSILELENREMSPITGQWRTNRQPSLLFEANRMGKEMDREAVYAEEIASTSDNDAVLPTVNSFTFNSYPEENWSRTCQTHTKDYEIDKHSCRSEVDEAIKHHPNTKASIGDIVLAGTPEHFYRYDDNQSCYSEITSVSTSEHSLVSLTNGNGSPVCEVTLVTTHENGVPVQTSDTLLPTRTDSGTRSNNEKDDGMSKECLAPRTKLKALLLSDPLFVTNLEELFDIQVHPDFLPCLSDEAVLDVHRARVLIDYANEVMLLESSQFPQAYLPQKWSFTDKPRNSHSLDRLLDEICSGIKDLGCYHRPVRDDTFTYNSLYLKLNRDLSFKSGIWETGWRRMFSQDEIDRVTVELDKAILGKVIEEIVSELLV